jgi:predicted phosphoribosyltransferase
MYGADLHRQWFADRRDAGVELAKQLQRYARRADVMVLGLPRGGVPVAYEVARALEVPLDIFIVRKLGLPSQRELAMGALASGGIRVLNDDVVRWSGVSRKAIEDVTRQERVELERREREYRGQRPPLDLANRVVILVDDGLATGSTMKAAVEAVRQQRPAEVVVAVPVGARDSCAEFERIADAVVCARMPEPFSAVGLWYRDFSETSDEEVRQLLRAHEAALAGERVR